MPTPLSGDINLPSIIRASFLHCFLCSTMKRPDLCTVLVVDIPNTTMLSDQCTRAHTVVASPQRPPILHAWSPGSHRYDVGARSSMQLPNSITLWHRALSDRSVPCLPGDMSQSAPPRPGPDRPRFHGQSEVTYPAYGKSDWTNGRLRSIPVHLSGSQGELCLFFPA